MLWNTFEDRKEKLALQYSEANWTDGLTEEELKMACAKICEDLKDEPKAIIKAKVFEFIMQNAAIEVNPLEMFADKINHCYIIEEIRNEWRKDIEETVMKECLSKNSGQWEWRAYHGDADFSHASPDWQEIADLGVAGLLQRAEKASEKDNLTDEQKVFYESCIIVYRAVICYMQRLAKEARRIGNDNTLLIAQNLENLTKHEPETLHEVMQITFIINYLMTFVEKVGIRSLGGLDRLYYRFYKADIESGRLTEEQARELLRYFMYRFYALQVTANSPFDLCGIDRDGKPVFNELTEMIVDEYDKLSVNDPKIHIKYTPDLPEEFIKKVLRIIRGGNSSFVVMNEDVIIKSLTDIGIELEDAREYVCVGCYEPCAMGTELPCTVNGRLSLVKAVQYAVTNGVEIMNGEVLGVHKEREPETFEEFYSFVKEQIAIMVDNIIELVSLYEENYMEINPSPLYSGAMSDCIKNGKDAYAGGAKYNNSSICSFGIATAIDSIMAVKYAVYEEKLVTLPEFADILKNDWATNPKLQLICQKKYPKYGNNIKEVDDIVVDLTDYIAEIVNGRKNARGGIYRNGLYSIDWYNEFGVVTGATPDGRNSCQPFSKNMSSVIGCDKNGVTDLINSVGKIDYEKCPNGTVLDVVLHSSAANGEDGLLAMLGVVKAFIDKGGIAIQLNVLSPDVLKKAQQDPEKYSTLQVRLCGWNVYFVDLSRQEQDRFIQMAEHVGA